jgi:Zn-dependent protease with chaperone function
MKPALSAPPAQANTPRGCFYGIAWTARRTWWASLLLTAAALTPLVVASLRLAPCLLNALSLSGASALQTLRATSVASGLPRLGGVSANVASRALVSPPCGWSWQELLCQPLASLATTLYAGPGSRATPMALLLLTAPAMGALLVSSLGLTRAAVVVARTTARTHAGAWELDRLALPESHAAVRRVARLAGAINLPSGRVHVLDDARPLAWTYGLWRPQIAVSSGLLDRLDDTALLAALAHEAAHVRRRDPLRRLISTANALACPYAPALTALDTHLRLRQELEADAVALSMSSARALACALLGVIASAPVTTSIQAPTTLRPALLLPAARQPKGWVWARRRGRADLAAAPPIAHVTYPLALEASRHSLAQRVDRMLGRVPAAGLLIPSGAVLLTMLGLLSMWCLLAW